MPPLRSAVRASLLAGLAVAAVNAAAAASAPAASSLPDIVASSTTAGQYTITNDSGVDVGSFKVKVTFEYGGFKASKQELVSGLLAHQTTTLSIGTTCGSWSVEADSRDKVSESNESNNSTPVDPSGPCF